MSYQDEIWLAIRPAEADGSGSGTPSDPFAVNTPSGFASVMRNPAKVPFDAIVRLMPGIYRTRGTVGNGYDSTNIEPFWQPRTGQKILGSGMHLTTLKFEWDLQDPKPQPGQRHNMILSADYLSSWELSDLTLDCNLQNAPFDPTVKESGTVTATVAAFAVTVTSSAGFFDASVVGKVLVFNVDPVFSARIVGYISSTQVTIDAGPNSILSGVPFTIWGLRFSITALSVTGDNIRIRRVRVINFGTRTAGKINGSAAPNYSTYEGFPLRVEGRTLDKPSFNSVIEDCIFEQPYPSPAREVTCCVMSSGSIRTADPTKRLHLQPLGSVIRNCYFNFDLVNEPSGLAGPISAITKSGTGPYTITVTTVHPHNVVSGDFIEMSGNAPSALNGRFLVNTVLTMQQLTIVLPSDPGSPSSFGTLWKSSKPTCRAALSQNVLLVTVDTTPLKHNRVAPGPGVAPDEIVITGASDDTYNGTFKVTSVIDSFHFTYTLESTPGGNPEGDIWLDRRPNGIVRVSAVKLVSNSPPKGELTFEGNHYQRTDDWIFVDGVLINGTTLHSYNNYLRVSAVLSKTRLEVELPGTFNTGTLNTSYPQGASAMFDRSFRAIGNSGGYGGGTFSNRVVNAKAGLYNDTFAEQELTARRNYLYDVYLGVYLTFPGTYGSQTDASFSSAFFAGVVSNVSNGVVTVRLTAVTANPNPGWYPGMALYLQRNYPSGPYSSVQIVSVIPPNPNISTDRWAFTFDQPAGNQFGVNDTVWCDIWSQQHVFSFEDNIVEISLTPKGGVNAGPRGIELTGPYYTTSPLPPLDGTFVQGNAVHGLRWNGPNGTVQSVWLFQNVVIRDNIMRKVANQLDPDGTSQTFALRLNSVTKLIVEGNIISRINNPPGLGQYAEPLEVDYSDAQNLKVFRNIFPDGRLRRVFNDPHWYGNVNYWIEEIETELDDLLCARRRNPQPF
jgi:hypothetical protein